jgi:hypothetical protein
VVDCTAGSSGTDASELQDTDVTSYLSPPDQSIKLLTEVEYMFAFFACTTFSIDVPIIFDTTASVVIAPNIGDFIEDPKPLPRRMTLGGMANDLKINGVGTVPWTFTPKDGSEVQIRTQAYWVPSAKARLLIPQRLFNKKQGVFGQYEGD